MKKDGDVVEKIKKFNLIIITIFVITNIIVANKCYGATINPNNYKPGAIVEDDTTINLLNKIIGGFQAIGSIVSVLALVMIGIKYMMGSIEEKAEYKKTMINYIIGAILVFAISNISAMIYNFAKTFNQGY